MAGLVGFAWSVGTVACVAVAVFYARPAFARARFESRVSALRDAYEEDLRSGVLPANRAGLWELRRINSLLGHSRDIRFSTAMAIKKVIDETGPLIVHSPSYNGLTPPQRRRLHEVGDAMQDEVAWLLIHGSIFWWALDPAQRLVRARRAPKAPTPIEVNEMAKNIWEGPDELPAPRRRHLAAA